MAIFSNSYPKNFDLVGFFKLVRFNNLLILVFTFYMIKIFLVDYQVNIWANLVNPHLFLLSFSTVCIAAAGYMINDYYDVKIDTINKPNRVIVGRVIKRRVVMAANLFLNFLGFLIALYLSKKVFLITLGAGFLLWWYSNYLKRLPLVGNITIAFLTSLAVILLSVYYRQNELMIYIFAIFAFFISLIREIVKDMEDVKGDANFGCKTLPIVWGIPRTKQVIYVFFFIFAIILLSTYLTFPHQFALYLYGVVIPPLVWFFIRLNRADRRKDFAFLSALCKIIMLLGVLSMVLV
ncbi:MAG: geranylgeranylglycerol-phosphate geranylgeranyltransferase [Microscillaceae bacterium]|nr:geranylgeranylglycerol-phosphate geranylgeranyltransferase [Microscillaceae bacterium]